MTGEPVASTACYRHPDRPTALACAQCGNPICPACAVPGTVGQFCPDCARQRGRQQTVRVRPGAAGPLYRVAPVTLVLLVVAVAIYLLGSLDAGLREELFIRFAQANFLIAEGDWYRIFSPVLLHGSATHVLFNMWALYQLGPSVERRVGRIPYLGLYLAAAGWGGMAAYRLGGIEDVLVGASGAIFGLFGLWIHSAFRLRDTAFGRNLLSSLGWTLLLNAALPLLIPGISWQGHLGGLLAGVVVGELWSRVPAAWRWLVPAAMAGLAVAAVLV